MITGGWVLLILMCVAILSVSWLLGLIVAGIVFLMHPPLRRAGVGAIAVAVLAVSCAEIVFKLLNVPQLMPQVETSSIRAIFVPIAALPFAAMGAGAVILALIIENVLAWLRKRKQAKDLTDQDTAPPLVAAPESSRTIRT